ncbi:hypothetical protein ACI782_01530 [Geodermatophilus sp. SYSU D00703]
MSGPLIDALLVLGAAAALGVLALVVARRAPRLALVAWLVTICAVPVWLGSGTGLPLEPQVVVGLGVLVALLPVRAAIPFRFTVADVVVAALLVSALVPAVLGRATVSSVVVLCVQWIGAFLLGRLVGHRVPLDRVYAAVAVAFTCVAVLALVEWGTGWNPFLSVPGSGGLYDTWAVIQERGGEARVEGAFGHSIALGGSLALALPLTLVAPFRPLVRAAMATVILLACAVTLSRIGVGTAVLGVVLALLVLPGVDLPARLRWWLAGGLVVTTAAVAPMVARVFAAAGDEASDSAAYRADLLGLLDDVQLLGLAPSYHVTPSGRAFFGDFRSIDSALVLLALNHGWIPLVCVLVGAALAVGAVLCGRATAPTVALVAQLPAVATVALITQYSGWLWFVAGLAVASHALGRRPTGGPAPSPLTPRGEKPLVSAGTAVRFSR